MRKTPVMTALLVLAFAGSCKADTDKKAGVGALPAAATAAAPAGKTELKTEDDKTIYAIGLAISQNLASFALTEAEVELLKVGLTDGVLNRDKAVDLNVYGPKIQEMAKTRATAAAEVEKKKSQAFLDKAAAEAGAKKTESGIIITSIKEGTGDNPKPTDQVKVHYRGTLVDGTVFDSSIDRGEPVTFALNGVIPCWTEGLQTMKPGGKSKLICPSDKAYGDSGRPPKIKGGATLIFEVELLEIVKPQAAEPGKAPGK